MTDQQKQIEAAYDEWIADENRYGLSGLQDRLAAHGLAIVPVEVSEAGEQQTLIKLALSGEYSASEEAIFTSAANEIGSLRAAIRALKREE